MHNPGQRRGATSRGPSGRRSVVTKKKTAMSRRRFLKKAGVGAGAAAAVAPAGASALVGEAAAAAPDPDIRLAPEFEPSRSAPLPERIRGR